MCVCVCVCDVHQLLNTHLHLLLPPFIPLPQHTHRRTKFLYLASLPPPPPPPSLPSSHKHTKAHITYSIIYINFPLKISLLLHPQTPPSTLPLHPPPPPSPSTLLLHPHSSITHLPFLGNLRVLLVMHCDQLLGNGGQVVIATRGQLH